jgi:hypothetical protein
MRKGTSVPPLQLLLTTSGSDEFALAETTALAGNAAVKGAPPNSCAPEETGQRTEVHGRTAATPLDGRPSQMAASTMGGPEADVGVKDSCSEGAKARRRSLTAGSAETQLELVADRRINRTVSEDLANTRAGGCASSAPGGLCTRAAKKACGNARRGLPRQFSGQAG